MRLGDRSKGLPVLFVFGCSSGAQAGETGGFNRLDLEERSELMVGRSANAVFPRFTSSAMTLCSLTDGAHIPALDVVLLHQRHGHDLNIGIIQQLDAMNRLRVVQIEFVVVEIERAAITALTGREKRSRIRYQQAPFAA